MSKNRSFKRGLTLTLALFILCGVLAIPCFAQASQIPLVDYNRYVNNIYVKTSDGLNSLANIQITYSTDSTAIDGIYIVYSEYFYNNVYSGNSTSDSLYIVLNQLDYDIRLTYSNRFKHYIGDNVYLIDALSEFSQGTFPVGDVTWYENAFLNDYENQFTYWEDEIEQAEQNGYNNGHSVGFDNGYAEGQQNGLQTGYNNGFEEGRNEGYNVGYTEALEDTNAFEEGIFDILNAPFVFISNLKGVEIFGISLFEIVGVILVLALGFILIRFIGGALPL